MFEVYKYTNPEDVKLFSDKVYDDFTVYDSIFEVTKALQRQVKDTGKGVRVSVRVQENDEWFDLSCLSDGSIHYFK